MEKTGTPGAKAIKYTESKPLSGSMQLSGKEKKLIEMIRALKFGEMRIIIQDSEPVRIEELKNSIKL